MKRNSILALLCAGAIVASAVPAKRGVKQSFTQPDGSTVSLSVVGDEFRHYYLTDDGQIVIGSEGAYNYAAVKPNGTVYNTGILAHDAAVRSAEEVSLLSGINSEAVGRAIMESPKGPMQVNNHDGIGLYDYSKFPTNGEVKALAFLVEFQDVSFTPGAEDYFHRMITEEGYSDNGATGSCYDYYARNSNGQFHPQFDVYGPVTLPNTRAWYGGNDINGNDKNPHYMMLHAAQALNNEVDFSQYDTDGDGLVDNVFIFFAGMSEAAGGGDDCVWPHSWDYTFNNVFDGVRFSRYACASELIEANKLDGIGTFCHEFGHVLGLPDLYNTVDAYAMYTPLDWDLMDQGCYNHDSKTPPALSAYERNALGWMGDNLIEIDGPCSVRLENLATCNSAVIIGTNKPKEFFIFENRQQKGDDRYLPHHGMLIWHIDYNANKWRSNTVNNSESHQYVDIVEACGYTSSNPTTMRRYPFPGQSRVTSFTYDGTPSFKSWGGQNIGLDITNIKETNGIITFDVAGGGELVSGIKDAVAQEINSRIADRRISVDSDGPITIVDMTGRVIASGCDKLTTPQLAPGIYIIATPSNREKILVK